MRRVLTGGLVCGAMVCLALALCHRQSPLQAQERQGEPVKARAAAATAEKDAKKAEKKLTGRLPAYYGELVDQKQREAIYKIQQEYEPKLSDLRKQLETLTQERDAKIRAVLTPEQQQKLDQLLSAAKAKRGEKKPPEKKAAPEARPEKPAPPAPKN